MSNSDDGIGDYYRRCDNRFKKAHEVYMAVLADPNATDAEKRAARDKRDDAGDTGD